MTLTALRESFGDIRRVTGRLERGQIRDGLAKLVVHAVVHQELADRSLADAANAVEITDRINRGHGTIGRLVAEDALYNQAEGALRGVTRATQGIEDQAPISVVGPLLGTLF